MSEPEKMKSVLSTMPEDWKEAFQARADFLGESLSEFLRNAGAERLTKRERSRLSEIVETRGRKTKGESPDC